MSDARDKRIAVGARPSTTPRVEAWVRQGDTNGLQKSDLYKARLTLDVTLSMRARIKVLAFAQGVMVAEMLRTLLERELPENTA